MYKEIDFNEFRDYIGIRNITGFSESGTSSSLIMSMRASVYSSIHNSLFATNIWAPEWISSCASIREICQSLMISTAGKNV